MYVRQTNLNTNRYKIKFSMFSDIFTSASGTGSETQQGKKS